MNVSMVDLALMGAFMALPFLPTPPLLLLDHLLIRIAAVLLVVYAISIGPLTGILTWLFLAALFLERNRRKIQQARDTWDALDVHESVPATLEQASKPSIVPAAPFDQPDTEETEFLPAEVDITMFEPVAPTINQKEVLATIYPVGHNSAHSTAAAESIYEQLGFGHVPGVITLS